MTDAIDTTAHRTTDPTARTEDGAAIFDLRDPGFMASAYDRYAELREDGAVVKVQFAGMDEPAAEGTEVSDADRRRRAFQQRDTWFVTRYDEVVEALLDSRYTVDPTAGMTPEMREQMEKDAGPFLPLQRSIISIDPPDHTRIRKLLQPSFTGRTMDALRGSIQQVIDDLLDEAEAAASARGETPGNRHMELISAVAYPFPVAVISDLLGIPAGDREQIGRWTENLLRVDAGRDAAMEESIRDGITEFTDYLVDLFERKRREPADDMISRMVLAEEDGDVLTKDETLATVFLMYLAGHVTTVNLVGSGIVALLTHPEELAELRSDPALAKNVVEETLRYWGPVDFIGRRKPTEDLELGGVVIAKGEEVTVSLGSANRDPRKFDRPDEFDISRADANRHIAFGKGIHVCLGAPLARVEGQIAFETLIRRYPELRLAIPEDELHWSQNFLRGFREIPLLF
jgi:cytochrome P450 PksS